jgi:hypothetical protein
MNNSLEVTPQTVKEIINEVKSGYRTSEFYFHIALQAATWVSQAYVGTAAAHVALVALSVLSLLGYTFSRTAVKINAGTTTTTLSQASPTKVAVTTPVAGSVITPKVS